MFNLLKKMLTEIPLEAIETVWDNFWNGVWNGIGYSLELFGKFINSIG